MHRVRRLFAVTAAVFSFLLALAAVAAWVRSHVASDFVRYSPRAGVAYTVNTRPGLLIVARQTLVGRTSSVFSDDYLVGPGARWIASADRGISPFTTDGSPPWLQWLGFDHLSHTTSAPRYGTRTFRRIIVPFWFLVALAIALPAWQSIVVVNNRRRRRAGRCAQCGYDLRATPDRCPECGTLQSPAS